MMCSIEKDLEEAERPTQGFWHVPRQAALQGSMEVTRCHGPATTKLGPLIAVGACGEGTHLRRNG